MDLGVTLAEALLMLQDGDGYCCVVPPVMDSSDGKPRIKCIVCGRTIAKVGQQWVVSDWGEKGIRMRGTQGAARLKAAIQSARDAFFKEYGRFMDAEM